MNIVATKSVNCDNSTKLNWCINSLQGTGYAAYGSSLAIVELDVLTGEHVVEECSYSYKTVKF